MVAASTLRRYAMYAVAALWVVYQFAKNTKLGGKGSARKTAVAGESGTRSGSVSERPLDVDALKKGRELAKRCFGYSFVSKEIFLLYALISVLLVRTGLSLVVADVDGHLVKHLINKDRRGSAVGVLMWLGIAIPSSFVNSLIKYLQARLALTMRTKLSAYTREKFFENELYYRVTQHRSVGVGAAAAAAAAAGTDHPSFAVALDPDVAKALEHPEAVMTEDIANWAERFAGLMSVIGKPLVDLVFLSAILYQKLGFINQFAASVIVWETGNLLKRFRPDFGAIVQERGNLEADLRSKHTKIIEASEEIAFCHGEARERERLSTLFERIVDFQQHKVLNRQVWYHMVEEFVTKYLWSAVGMVQVAVPLLHSGTNAGDNAKYFITIRRVMVSSSDAVERILTSMKLGVEYNGFSVKITNFLNGLECIAASRAAAVAASSAARKTEEDQDGSAPLDAKEDSGEVAGNGNHLEDFVIVVRDVPIRTPQGDLLLERLNLSLKRGDRLMVLGPNGCGKSSLFRVLCGLWPHSEGYIRKPPGGIKDLFFVPQRPYLVVGTLRDQIIYPDTREDMQKRGVTDDDLKRILDWVLMSATVAAHGGLDSVNEWSEVLSGGEKQRLGLARVFYRRPMFAVLDECSSAINVEAEQQIFQRLVSEGMGLITISHRQTLFPFHNKLLTFDGDGKCHFEESFQFDELSKKSEKRLQLMKRLERVLQDLGEDWPKTLQDALTVRGGRGGK